MFGVLEVVVEVFSFLVKVVEEKGFFVGEIDGCYFFVFIDVFLVICLVIFEFKEVFFGVGRFVLIDRSVFFKSIWFLVEYVGGITVCFMLKVFY